MGTSFLKLLRVHTLGCKVRNSIFLFYGVLTVLPIGRKRGYDFIVKNMLIRKRSIKSITVV